MCNVFLIDCDLNVAIFDKSKKKGKIEWMTRWERKSWKEKNIESPMKNQNLKKNVYKKSVYLKVNDEKPILFRFLLNK